MSGDCTLHLGDCLDVMPGIPDASIDAIITDPPYPEIDRPYGRMTEAEWDAMMRRLIPECRRVLKPTGSAVFILQPNSEKVGRMRPWLWEFMAWTCREWNQVQDAWWWNYAIPPTAGATRGGLMRGSVKTMVWLGPDDCYRDQDATLWAESELNAKARKWEATMKNERRPSVSGHNVKDSRCRSRAVERGGTTPFNLLPLTNGYTRGSGKNAPHGAATPPDLADWWVRYITRPGDVILDPFAGVGTVPLAAMARGRKAIGIERHEPYFAILDSRLLAPFALARA